MEKIIELKLEHFDECVLVSSPQFPLFHLSVDSTDDEDLEACVLPMLTELIERQEKIKVELRLIRNFSSHYVPSSIPTHIIAQMKAQ